VYVCIFIIHLLLSIAMTLCAAGYYGDCLPVADADVDNDVDGGRICSGQVILTLILNILSASNIWYVMLSKI